MEYHKVATKNQITEGQIIPIEAAGKKLLLAMAEGELYAAQRKCPHMGYNLCKGHLEGRGVVCPLHKARYNLGTGEVEREPKLLFIQMKAKHELTTFPVRVEGDDVLVGI